VRRPDIEGWTSDVEAAELQRLAAGKTVLEIGAFKGLGTLLMAQAGATVWSVDWHRGDSGGDGPLGPRDTLCAWWTNVRRHHVEDQVVGLVGRSRDVLPILKQESFDLVFIDGDHAYESVLSDAILCRELVKPGGTLVFHDYSRDWPEVVRAVDDWLGAWSPNMRLVGSLAIVGL
jgi:hypothetical protein